MIRESRIVDREEEICEWRIADREGNPRFTQRTIRHPPSANHEMHDPPSAIRDSLKTRSAIYYFLNASYTASIDTLRTGGVPAFGREPLRFWIMPTNTKSFVGSIQNHVPKAPPQ